MRHAIAIAAFLLVALAGCDKEAAVPATGSTAPASTPKSPVPPPAANPANDSAARTAALAAGPGTCEQDVPNLRTLPNPGQLGFDRSFDRMAVHPQAYRACLVAMVRDRTPMADPGPEPKRTPYDQGVLAYELLHRLGHIEQGECVPADVVTQGGSAMVQWLDDKNHRRQVHRCLGKKLGL